MIAHTNASYDKNMFALSKSSKIESIKKSCKGIQKEQEHSALYFATLFIIHIYMENKECSNMILLRIIPFMIFLAQPSPRARDTKQNFPVPK